MAKKAKKVVQDVSGLVEQFRGYVQKSAENILEMGRVVLEAKRLGRTEFADFCEAIGFQPKSGTIRKYIRIGERYAVFKANQSKLPVNWTTLYTISQIEPAKLQTLFDDEKIHPSVSGKEASRLVGKKAKAKLTVVPNGTASGYGIQIKFGKLSQIGDASELRELLDKLAALGAAVQCSPSLEEFFDESEQPLAA